MRKAQGGGFQHGYWQQVLMRCPTQWHLTGDLSGVRCGHRTYHMSSSYYNGHEPRVIGPYGVPTPCWMVHVLIMEHTSCGVRLLTLLLMLQTFQADLNLLTSGAPSCTARPPRALPVTDAMLSMHCSAAGSAPGGPTVTACGGRTVTCGM
jgi:hypothetical protein